MSLTISRPGAGKHRVDDVIAERDARIQQLKQRIAELTEETGVLAADCSTFADDLVRDIIRGCQDAIALAAARDENQALKARVKELGDKVIRAEADKQRLRQAVVDARPRITEVTQRLDRPYVSHVQIPYPVPVGRDMSADDTQEIPLIDQPEPAAWPTYTVQHPGVAS